EIDQALARLRTNTPGLERREFAELANALQRYRDVANWAAASPLRDTRQDYERLLIATQRLLTRHLERPTEETTWGLQRLIGAVDALGSSPRLVQAVKKRFGQANLAMSGSSRLTQVLAARPIDQTAPVRDVILGTRLFGTSRTLGSADLRILPARNHIELLAIMQGQAAANTNGYNGPVRIRSRSTTALSATAQVELSDASFRLTPAHATAQTRSRIQSIRKTGGNFGRRLIEKIAWRRAAQQKRAAERIAAQHAADRAGAAFHEELNDVLARARREYVERVREPLIRRDAFPEHLRMSSTEDAAHIEATIARRMQFGADAPPPAAAAAADFSVRIHQSAANNYLALALAGATFRQQSVDRPPEVKGDVPPWLRELADRQEPVATTKVG
ncbi:MAG: hypothetical protein AAF961_18305, partial [Planctomycetota bacterium]